jgi:hypothetical protein
VELTTRRLIALACSVAVTFSAVTGPATAKEGTVSAPLQGFLESGDRNCCLSAAPALAQPMLPLTVTVETGRAGSTLTLPVVGRSG